MSSGRAAAPAAGFSTSRSTAATSACISGPPGCARGAREPPRQLLGQRVRPRRPAGRSRRRARSRATSTMPRLERSMTNRMRHARAARAESGRLHPQPALRLLIRGRQRSVPRVVDGLRHRAAGPQRAPQPLDAPEARVRLRRDPGQRLEPAVQMKRAHPGLRSPAPAATAARPSRRRSPGTASRCRRRPPRARRPVGRQRRQARNPARSAACAVAWKDDVLGPGPAGRRRTAGSTPPSSAPRRRIARRPPASRPATAAQRGSAAMSLLL